MTRLTQADTPEAVATVRGLFVEYVEFVNYGLCFQGFDDELAQLPGYYAPPSGRLLLATVNGAVADCDALRDLGQGACKIKRL